ncbi:MAG: sigma-70 family RNA polymerase sigma factor [Erysipelotrichales bacterium]|nr:sigma-70 family RNA polymerase sigma factor [Erysipelotrichales bacterium]
MNTELLEKAINGDEVAKEEFVKNNMGLVYNVVYRFKNSNKLKEDLVQVGCLGLVKAINNFDLSYNVAFSTYAVPIILGEIKRYFRDEGSIHISRSVKENYLFLVKQKETLEQQIGREISYKELADHVGFDIYDVVEAFEANQFVTSLDEEINDDDNKKVSLSDFIPSNEGIDPLLVMSMKKEISKLSQRDQMLLYYRYELDYNQSKIAEIFKVSQVQISRSEKRILNELKKRINNE